MASTPGDNVPVTESQNNQTPRTFLKTRYIIIIALLTFMVIAVLIGVIIYFAVGRNSGSDKSVMTSTMQQYTQLTGNNVQLPCHVGNKGNDVMWYYQGQKISIGNRFSLSGKSLSIQNLEGSDGGEYVCESGTTKASPIKLAVAGNVGFVVPYKNGGYIVSVERSLVHFDWETKAIKTLHTVDHGTFNVINDGKVDPKGRVWTGTFGNFTDLEDPIYFYKGSMYMMDLDGSLHKKWENITISNGFSWTRDNTTMYYVDSIPRKVYRFDYDVDTGDIKYQGVAIDFVHENEDFHVLGLPDGMAMDTEGMLWIACYDAAKIVRFNPNTGERLRIIDFKGIARRTTSCCFGGPNFDILYVTSGGAQSQEESKQDVYSGSVFRVTGLGVRGYPGRIYQGVV